MIARMVKVEIIGPNELLMAVLALLRELGCSRLNRISPVL
jgi:vacuolar-type H+-ATPase subunit I/STV1